ncbi:MAG: hypothetical protein ABID64_00560 [Nitrospirota bacterium]
MISMIKKISLILFSFLFLSFSLSVSASFIAPEDTIHAWGHWSSSAGGVNQSGIISFDFPPGGGEVDGNMTGTGDQFGMDMEGFFDGNFTGGWDGTFSGTYTTVVSYNWVNPSTGATESTTQTMSGVWSGSVTKDGQMNVTISPSNAPSNNMTANFDVGEFDTELRLSEYDDDKLMQGDIEEEGIAEVSGEMTYMIVDGERYELDVPIQVRSGMTFGVEHENGSLYLDIGEDHTLFMSGIGEVTVFLAEDIDKSKWADIMGQQPKGSVVTMMPGQVVVKYKTGSAENYWVPGEFENSSDPNVISGFEGYEQKIDNPEDQTEMTYIMLETKDTRGMDLSVFSEAIGTIGGLRYSGHRPAPIIMPQKYASDNPFKNLWGMLFGNESEVEYDYDGENLKVNVLEGRVTVFDTDFEGNSVIVAVVESGESYEVNIEEYYDEKFGEDGDGDSENILQYIIGFGILFVFFVLLAVLGIRRMKKGKMSKHWKDY